MQYQACPKEPWCGNYYIIPDKNGKSKEYAPGGDKEYIYKDGALCTY